MNRFVWDMREESMPAVPGLLVLGDYSGAIVAPGTYWLKMTVGEDVSETSAQLIPDPRLEATERDYTAQQEMLMDISGMVKDIHARVNRMRNVRRQVKQLLGQLKKQEGMEALTEEGEALIKAITAWEENLVQPKTKTFQDVINFPNQLNAELLTLKGRVETNDPLPTEGAQKRLEDLEAQWSKHLEAMNAIIEGQLAAFNQHYAEQELPAIFLEKE